MRCKPRRADVCFFFVILDVTYNCMNLLMVYKSPFVYYDFLVFFVIKNSVKHLSYDYVLAKLTVTSAPWTDTSDGGRWGALALELLTFLPFYETTTV